jgi:hypothetical protein
MKLERVYLARSCSLLAGGGSHSRRLIGGQVETNVEVYNKLDSEDEDKSILVRSMQKQRYRYTLYFVTCKLSIDTNLSEKADVKLYAIT